MTADRLEAIMEVARREGRVTVQALSELFRVTPQTIRRDLLELCDKRLLKRMHGGAVLSADSQNIHYDARRQIRARAKEAIGRAAADLVPNNSSLFINIGTTTEAVARALLQHKELRVITNSINVAKEMTAYPNIEVSVVGGQIRDADGIITGDNAASFISQFKCDFCVMGVSSVDADGALLNFDYENAKIIQAMIANSRRTLLVADASKFEQSAPVRVGSLDQMDVLVTDHCPSVHVRNLCAEFGVQLLETSAER